MTEELDLGLVLEHYGISYRPDRAGEQMISCPVHADRKPSASLNLSKGLIACHACGFGGDAISVIENREGVDYQAATEIFENITGKRCRQIPATTAGKRNGNKIPSQSGYKPIVRRKLPTGVRKRTDFGA